jgi:hypothetical protein
MAQPKADAKPASEAKTPETSGDVANPAGVKAKGISEKGLLEKNAAAEKAVVEKPAEKPADKPAETTASVPAEPRRHQPTPREKTAVRVIPLTPAQPALPAAAPNPAPAIEAAAAPDERRDANDLARAAIERLRTGNDGAQRPQEAARATDAPRNPEAARVPEAPRVAAAPALRPLPPPIMVSAPPTEPVDQPKSPSAAEARADDPHRPTPPAEIPTARPPLDLRAEMAEPRREKTSVAEDVLSAAKSVFHAVLPK